MKGEQSEWKVTDREPATADFFGEAQTAQFSHLRVPPCESFRMPPTHQRQKPTASPGPDMGGKMPGAAEAESGFILVNSTQNR